MKEFKANIIILISMAVCLSCGRSATHRKAVEQPTTPKTNQKSEISPGVNRHDFIQDNVKTTSEEKPSQFAFWQRPPGPFCPSFIFYYTLPCSSPVRLGITDAARFELNSTEMGYQQLGSYSFGWNPTDFQSGIYYLTLQACDSSITLKTILMK
jgi:hypothetical protein